MRRSFVKLVCLSVVLFSVLFFLSACGGGGDKKKSARAVLDLVETTEDNPITFKPFSDGLTGRYASLQPPRIGTLVDHEDGRFTYTPADNFTGSVQFLYVLEDGPVVDLDIVVAPQNDAPVAQADLYVTRQNRRILKIQTGLLLAQLDFQPCLITKD